MPRTPGLSNAAFTFLRAFRAKNPAGPTPDAWPSPAILRRWLRRPAFRAALGSIQDTLQLQADFHLSSAATRAAARLDDPDDSAGQGQGAQAHERLARLLRLSHLRQRSIPSPDASHPSEPPFKRPITRQDVLDHIHLLEPNLRLNDKELRSLCRSKDFWPPIYEHPDFPPPIPQDTFYYNLLQHPDALLWYMRLIQDQTPDHRYSAILSACGSLVPRKSPGYWPGPDKPLPRFRDSTPTDQTPVTPPRSAATEAPPSPRV